MNNTTKLANQVIDTFSTDDRLFKVKDIPSTHTSNFKSNDSPSSHSSQTHTTNYSTASTDSTPSYCIIRLGKKYTTIQSLSGFFRYTKRERDTESADKNKTSENVVLIDNDYQKMKDYLKDVHIHKNSVLGIELLLTASPQFFYDLPKQELNKWVDKNMEWLYDNYGNMVQFAILHLDETSPHLHVLISCKQLNERYKKYTMQNYKFFGTPQQLRDLQDNYYNAMKESFPALERGLKGSKAKNITVRQFYNIINGKGTEDKEAETMAKAKQAEILAYKLKYQNKTLKNYEKKDIKNRELIDKMRDDREVMAAELNKLTEDKDLYNEALQKFADTYKIPLEQFNTIYQTVKDEKAYNKYVQELTGVKASQTQSNKLVNK